MVSNVSPVKPSCQSDQVTYGIGMLASLGVGASQVHHMLTQGSSNQGWVSLAGSVVAFAVATFGMTRSSQNAGTELQSQDVTSASLPAAGYSELGWIDHKIEQINQGLGIPTRDLPQNTTETPEQRILGDLDNIWKNYQDIKQELKDTQDDLGIADQQIETLQAIIEENGITLELFQQYVKIVEQQVKTMEQSDKENAPQVLKICESLQTIKNQGDKQKKSNDISASPVKFKTPVKRPDPSKQTDASRFEIRDLVFSDETKL